MGNFVIQLKTLQGSFFAGKIRAVNVGDADIAAFFICKGLQNDGFEEVLSVEAIDYNDFKGSLQVLPKSIFTNYINYHIFLHSECDNCHSVEDMIKFFEKREEYEKCANILSKHRQLIAA